MLQGATVNYLQGLAAEKVKEIADKLDSEVARAALQGLVACAGAAAQGGSCGAGASGAAASVVLNNLLDGLNGKAVGSLTAEEKEARSKLISSIVAGTAAATGGETAATTIAAKLETENNALAPPFLLPGIPGKPQVTPLPGLPGYDKTEQDLGLEPRGFAEQLAELMGKGLEGIPLTQAGWAQYLIENLGGAVRVYDPNSYSTNDSAADDIVKAGKAAKGSGAGKAAEGLTISPSLLKEMSKNGVKFTPKNIIATARTPDGKIVFLETGNSRAGLQHVVENHADDFANIGIQKAQIPKILMQAVSEGKVVGHQGQGNGRVIYETVVNGQRQRIAISVADNGFIVGANPAGRIK